jgi:hypothetical protein
MSEKGALTPDDTNEEDDDGMAKDCGKIIHEKILKVTVAVKEASFGLTTTATTRFAIEKKSPRAGHGKTGYSHELILLPASFQTATQRYT